MFKLRRKYMKVYNHPDEVWCADIASLRMLHGFVYLVAIMDWYSCSVLSWKISTTLDTNSVSRPWNKSWRHPSPRSSTLIEGVGCPAVNLPGGWRKTISGATRMAVTGS
jgi:transposase InsO family protein